MVAQIPTSLPTLRRGAGIDSPELQEVVRLLQSKLGLSADGKFGSGTEAAVKKFQQNRGLTADGVVGKGTWTALLGAVAPTPIVSNSASSSSGKRWLNALAKVPITSISVSAAQENGRADLQRVQQIASRIQQVAAKYDFPAAVIAAIASRESNCGAALDSRGYGDHGNAFGIMQVDIRYHTPVGNDPSSIEHIDQGTKILTDYLKQLQQSHPDWEDEYLLKGAAAAYNCGPGNIQTKNGIDRGTTHDNYGSDVMGRAQFFAQYL